MWGAVVGTPASLTSTAFGCCYFCTPLSLALTNLKVAVVGLTTSLPALESLDGHGAELSLRRFENIESFFEQQEDYCGLVLFEHRHRLEWVADQLLQRRRWIPTVGVLRNADIRRTVGLVRKGVFEVVPLEEGQEQRCLLHSLQLLLEAPEPIHRLSTAMSRCFLLDELECDILKGQLAGDTNKRISARLGLSERTIELRRRKILQKFEAGSLAQVIREVSWVELVTGWGFPSPYPPHTDQN